MVTAGVWMVISGGRKAEEKIRVIIILVTKKAEGLIC